MKKYKIKFENYTSIRENMKRILPAIMTILIIVTPLSSVSAANEYVVKKGDTLWGISQVNKLSVQEIMSWNKLKTSTIAIGQKIKLTKSTTGTTGPTVGKSETTDVIHTVVKGETLYAISAKYKVSVRSIMTLNQMKTTVLMIGQKIKLSTKAGEVTPTPVPTVTTTMGIATTSVYMRQSASPTAKSLLILPKNASIKILDKTSTWWKIDYKGKIGIQFIEADRWYPSSKTCSGCGYIKKKLSLSERQFKCESCNFSIDRDLNASINLSRYTLTA